jgi:hypothetical protein
MIHIKIDYLKRVGNRTARSERSKYEIKPFSYKSPRIIFKLLSAFNIVRVDCCTVLVFGLILEARELFIFRVREAFI